MDTARSRILAFALCFSLVTAAAMVRGASAQCVPDTPTGGQDQTPTCTDSDHAHAGAPGGMLIARVPLHVFVHNPVGAAVCWMVARSQSNSGGGQALRPKGKVESLRGGRTPRQVAW